MSRINYQPSDSLYAASRAVAALGSESQREAARLRREAAQLRDAIAREAHQQLADGSPDDVLVWASAPSGEEAWGIINYGQHVDEPLFGVTYYDGDVSVGVCGAGYDTFDEALQFALTKPLVDSGYELVVV